MSNCKITASYFYVLPLLAIIILNYFSVLNACRKKMLSPESNKKTEPPNNVKIVISVFAFIGLLAFSVGGLVYMSHKYSPTPKQISVALHSLTVERLFHVQGASPLLATWDANIIIHYNRDDGNDDDKNNDDMKIIVRNLQSALYYKYHGISCAAHMKPALEIMREKERMLRLKFDTKSCINETDAKLDNKLEQKMREERKGGRLRVSLKMNMVVSSDFLLSPNSTGRYWRTDVRCSNEFDVVYVNRTNKGTMVGHDLKLWHQTCNFDPQMINSH